MVRPLFLPHHPLPCYLRFVLVRHGHALGICFNDVLGQWLGMFGVYSSSSTLTRVGMRLVVLEWDGVLT